MTHRTRSAGLALVLGATLALATGCTDDRAGPSAPADPRSSPSAPAANAGVHQKGPDRSALERQARRLALALADPDFRSFFRTQIDRSPYREHKVHFQALVSGGNGVARRALARATGETEAAVSHDAASSLSLETYLPVASHRAGWQGDANLLVATAVADADAPVAFDVHGRRTVLSPRTPPSTPVIALVPAELDFSRAGDPSFMMCTESCGSGGGGSGPSTPTPGLYMTTSHLRDTYEGWLKGSPEIEILVLGQLRGTDSLTKYQCVGERMSGPYYFNQDNNDWSGNVLLFSQSQIDSYKAAHPGEATRLFFMEDDDTSCEIRNENFATLLGEVDATVRGLSGGRDSTSSTLKRVWKYFKVGQKLFSLGASLINTPDDLIGNAVEDVTTGERYAGYNWIIKGNGGATNGYANLLMR